MGRGGGAKFGQLALQGGKACRIARLAHVIAPPLVTILIAPIGQADTQSMQPIQRCTSTKGGSPGSICRMTLVRHARLASQLSHRLQIVSSTQTTDGRAGEVWTMPGVYHNPRRADMNILRHFG